MSATSKSHPLVVNLNDEPYDASTMVYVGPRHRSKSLFLPASQWENPFKVGEHGWTREEVIAKFRAWLLTQPKLIAELASLRGKRLACWHAPLPCHADVLAELANAEPWVLALAGLKVD